MLAISWFQRRHPARSFGRGNLGAKTECWLAHKTAGHHCSELGQCGQRVDFRLRTLGRTWHTIRLPLEPEPETAAHGIVATCGRSLCCVTFVWLACNYKHPTRSHRNGHRLELSCLVDLLCNGGRCVWYFDSAFPNQFAAAICDS